MSPNFGIIAIAAIVPLVLGSIWYNPRLLGKAWMKSANLNEDYLKKGNMLVIFGLTYILCIFLGLMLSVVVIHQFHIYSIFQASPEAMQEGTELNAYLVDFMNQYGNNFRTFKHGMLHGGIAAVLFALPIIAIISLFERRGGKYIFIHWGYWFISLMIMGGIICQFT